MILFYLKFFVDNLKLLIKFQIKTMANFVERSRLFNAFIILVFLAHCVQLVWNQPLIARQSPIAPIPLNPDNLDYNSDSLLGSSPSVSASSSSLTPKQNHEARNSNSNRGITTGPENSRPLEATTNSLCSIFRTFLDSRSVQCRVLNKNSEDNVDSNALIQIQSPTSNSLRLTEADSRIDHDILNSQEEDENDEGIVKGVDDTKILQDKTTIIVPDRPCPTGQRRDPRGYCRTVLHIRTYNGQQISVRPVRYYYRRYVAIPTLHFILP